MSDEYVLVSVPKAALDDFWSFQNSVYDGLGPAADDFYDICAEDFPRYVEVYDALRNV